MKISQDFVMADFVSATIPIYIIDIIIYYIFGRYLPTSLPTINQNYNTRYSHLSECNISNGLVVIGPRIESVWGHHLIINKLLFCLEVCPETRW